MGLIRPGQTLDGAGRWAISLEDADDDQLVGTRAAILRASELLDGAGLPHAVYRRPATDAPWQLVQAPTS